MSDVLLQLKQYAKAVKQIVVLMLSKPEYRDLLVRANSTLMTPRQFCAIATWDLSREELQLHWIAQEMSRVVFTGWTKGWMKFLGLTGADLATALLDHSISFTTSSSGHIEISYHDLIKVIRENDGVREYEHLKYKKLTADLYQAYMQYQVAHYEFMSSSAAAEQFKIEDHRYYKSYKTCLYLIVRCNNCRTKMNRADPSLIPALCKLNPKIRAYVEAQSNSQPSWHRPSPSPSAPPTDFYSTAASTSHISDADPPKRELPSTSDVFTSQEDLGECVEDEFGCLDKKPKLDPDYKY